MGQTHCNSKLLDVHTQRRPQVPCFVVFGCCREVHCFHFARVAVCFVIFLRLFRTWRTPLEALKRSGFFPLLRAFQGVGSALVVASASTPVGGVKQACRGPWEPRVAHSNN